MNKDFTVVDSFCENELEPGKMETYTDGIYKYVYGGFFRESGDVQEVKGQYGWGVQLEDRVSETPVAQAPLNMLRGYPVINLTFAFYNSNAKLIDLSDKIGNLKVSDNIFQSNFGNIATIMASAFSGAAATKIILPKGFGKKARDMSNMFYGSHVDKLILPAGFGIVAEDMSHMFQMSNNKEIVFPEGFGKKTKNMRRMFSDTKLEKITFPTGFGSNALDISFMFFGSKITSMFFPFGFGAKAVTIDWAFFTIAATVISTATQEEADKWNNSADKTAKADNLEFIILSENI